MAISVISIVSLIGLLGSIYGVQLSTDLHPFSYRLAYGSNPGFNPHFQPFYNDRIPGLKRAQEPLITSMSGLKRAPDPLITSMQSPRAFTKYKYVGDKKSIKSRDKTNMADTQELRAAPTASRKIHNSVVVVNHLNHHRGDLGSYSALGGVRETVKEDSNHEDLIREESGNELESGREEEHSNFIPEEEEEDSMFVPDEEDEEDYKDEEEENNRDEDEQGQREEEEEEEEDEDPETVSDLIEGDIAVPQDNSRLSINFSVSPAKRWMNNTVPYLISSEHTGSEILVIESAMQTIGFLSCVKFRVWDGKEKDYLYFHPDRKRKGCWSYIGRKGGKQQVSLEQPNDNSCSCFCSPGRALHEIMHTLGFYHEHSRADRDNYIKIMKNNVRKGKLANFVTKTDDDTTRNFEYDYESIMHYGPYFFSKNKQGHVATIVPIKAGANIGQREMLSRVDCMKVNSLYGCLSSEDSIKNRKIQILCAMVGF